MGCASSDHAFGLIGFSPLRGSHRGALFGCDGSRGSSPLQRSTDRPDASIFDASACYRLRYGLRRIAWILSVRFAPCPIRLALFLFRGRQKERKRCEVYSISETIEKAPSLSLPKNERAYALKKLLFYKIFEFKKNSRYLPAYA